MVNRVEIEAEYSPLYRRINVAGIFGGIVAGGLEAVIYSEERRIDKILKTQPISTKEVFIKRTAEADLIIDPMQMKSIHQWLGEKIEEYERVFGKIVTSEQLDERLTTKKKKG
jgi:hypothetical protein